MAVYKDGTKVVTNPQMYGYFFRGASRTAAYDSAAAICLMLNSSKVLGNTSVRTGKNNLKVILLKIENGKISDPEFLASEDSDTVVLSQVLCRD